MVQAAQETGTCFHPFRVERIENYIVFKNRYALRIGFKAFLNAAHVGLIDALFAINRVRLGLHELNPIQQIHPGKLNLRPPAPVFTML